MSYLLDKKTKRNNFLKIGLGVFILLILIYFRTSIFNGLSYVTNSIFRSVLIFGNNAGEKFSNAGSFVYSKSSLLKENEDLKLQVNELSNKILNYNSVVAENVTLKEILGRKDDTPIMTLSSILSKPNQSLYDTLIIDAGENQGVLVEQKVFAKGNIPIGRIDAVYPKSSKVILYSNPGEKTEVIISGKDIFMQAIGRGGGNFEMTLSRDLILEKGTEVVLPGIIPYILGTVETIISDPRDSFQKALLVSPVNIQEIKFVEVEK